MWSASNDVCKCFDIDKVESAREVACEAGPPGAVVRDALQMGGEVQRAPVILQHSLWGPIDWATAPQEPGSSVPHNHWVPDVPAPSGLCSLPVDSGTVLRLTIDVRSAACCYSLHLYRSTL